VGKKVVGAATGVHQGLDSMEFLATAPARHKNEHLPLVVDALSEKRVIGAAAGVMHTSVWTEEEGLFTFGEATRNERNSGHEGVLSTA